MAKTHETIDSALPPELREAYGCTWVNLIPD